MTTIEDDHGPLGPEELAAFEKTIGARLPADYRAFLEKHNGGEPDPADFQFGTGDYTDSTVEVFLGVGIEDDDFATWLDVYKGRIPPELLAIARDPLGNVIVLCIRGEQRGAVMFWDHDEETAPPGWSNVHRISSSFTEFLDGLTTLED